MNENCIYVEDKNIKYDTVKEAMKDAGVVPQTQNKASVLVWYDSLVDNHKIFDISSWQTINRIPGINALCRKVPFAYATQRMKKFFPEAYSFIPKTFVLPDQSDEFVATRHRDNACYIIKPNAGSLGKGITIVDPEQSGFAIPDESAVAQEYIDSVLLDNTKFDLRIYVLLASIRPIRIYVYRDGIARFCAEDATHTSNYSRLTNVGLNKNFHGVEFSNISRLISDVFPILESKGVDIAELWRAIDRVVVLSIISVFGYIHDAVIEYCPPTSYNRCFQVLGFDILLDRELNPHVLEVNYRPSLDFHRGKERRMKVAMIRDAILLGAPLFQIQSIVNSRKWSWSKASWASYISLNPKLINNIIDIRNDAEKSSGFSLVFPCKSPELEEYKEMITKCIEISRVPLPVPILDESTKTNEPQQ